MVVAGACVPVNPGPLPVRLRCVRVPGVPRVPGVLPEPVSVLSGHHPSAPGTVPLVMEAFPAEQARGDRR